MFTAVHNFIHLNLAISLLIGYLVFALGVELAASNKVCGKRHRQHNYRYYCVPSSNQIGCKAVTALVQYFFLAAFSWMLCEGVMLYLMLVKVFSTLKEKWWFFLLLGWGKIIYIILLIMLLLVYDYRYPPAICHNWTWSSA